MSKLDNLSQKLTDALNEVSDSIDNTIEKAKTPEAKEKVHKVVNETGEWIGHTTNVIGDAFDGLMNDLNNGYEKGRKK